MIRVRRAAVRLAVLPGVALLLTACQSMSIDSGPPNFSQEKAAATLSPPSTTGNFSGPTPTSPSVTPSTEPPASAIPGTATALSSYLEKSYSTATWYGDVTRVDTSTGGVTVETQLQPAPQQVSGPATSICKAVRTYQKQQGGPAAVTINAKGGTQLKRVTKTQSC
jgi:hypothetical protein